MKQFRLFLLMLTPSPLSGVLTTLSAVLLLVTTNWSYTVSNSFLNDFLYGETGIITRFNSPTSKISVYTEAFSAQYITYEVVVFIAAVTLAFIIYMILQTITRTTGSVRSTADQLHGLRGASKLDLELSLVFRIAVRAVAILLWFFYWLLTVKLLLPFAVLATQLTLEDIFTSSAWLYGILGILVMIACIHFHVFFARLTLLRPRMFGGSEAIELAILED